MAKLIEACLVMIALVVGGCGGSEFGPRLFGNNADADADADTKTEAGADEYAPDVVSDVTDAAICPQFMFLVESGVCVDEKPALLGDGTQGGAVSWESALAICESRGARLCSEIEREDACPNGQFSVDPSAKEVYCGGPANTWEWSSSPTCGDGRCLSPCCNSVTNPCHCTEPLTQAESYHCCKDPV